LGKQRLLSSSRVIALHSAMPAGKHFHTFPDFFTSPPSARASRAHPEYSAPPAVTPAADRPAQAPPGDSATSKTDPAPAASATLLLRQHRKPFDHIPQIRGPYRHAYPRLPFNLIPLDAQAPSKVDPGSASQTPKPVPPRSHRQGEAESHRFPPASKLCAQPVVAPPPRLPRCSTIPGASASNR